MAEAAATPPVAPRHPTTRSHHGHDFVDDYEWLRAKDDPAVIAHLKAENAHTEQVLAPLAPLREAIFDEIRSRTLETDLSVPVREGRWWYYTRTVEGQQYGINCRAPIAADDDWTPPEIPAGGAGLPAEEVLLDGNVEARGHDFFAIGSFDVSTDGRLLLYAVDTSGDERYELRVKHLDTGVIDEVDVIPGTFPGAVFSPDGEYVFYPTMDDAWRPDTVWRHRVGSPGIEDAVVFREDDERFWAGVGVTRSRRYIVVESSSKVTSECLLLDADDPEGEPRTVWPRRDGVEYDVEHVVHGGEDRLLITHNDGAANFELVSVSASNPQGAKETLIAHSAETRIDGVAAFAGFVAVEFRRDGLAKVGLLRGLGARHGEPRIDEVAFDEPLFTAGLGANPDWLQPSLRLSYGSLVTPATVLDYDVDGGQLTVLKRQPVLGGYDPGDYVERREWATADDGVRVPISLVWKRGIDETVPAPTLLYGYGSYEASVDPSFSVPRLSLLDRGMVFAIAHVRGGGELGRHWYESGKSLHKRNSFTDFVAAARHLIDAGVTTPAQLVAEGHSAGGLLVGAVTNLAPEMFAGVLAGVPFVDALTTILDPSLPLTVIEWEEWGDPLHDAEAYEYMRAYSPYENVRDDVAYPRILAVTSLNDTRVLYVEPAKWVARLRDVGAPALLKTEMAAGHGGVSGRYDAWRERAFELAWILDAAGATGSA